VFKTSNEQEASAYLMSVTANGLVRNCRVYTPLYTLHLEHGLPFVIAYSVVTLEITSRRQSLLRHIAWQVICIACFRKSCREANIVCQRRRPRHNANFVNCLRRLGSATNCDARQRALCIHRCVIRTAQTTRTACRAIHSFHCFDNYKVALLYRRSNTSRLRLTAQ